MQVTVGPLPRWIPVDRLLGPGAWDINDGHATAELDRRAAADVDARLRGLVLAGRPITVEVVPGLKRPVVRQARTDEARRRRETTPGFTRPGARVDDEGRWSLTPEALALRLGQRFAGQSVVDACCGVGGNAIGFARAGCRVVAIDADPDRLELARHNAGVYGVALDLRLGRAQDLVPALSGDVLFVDPPWTERYREPMALADLPVLPDLLRDARGFGQIVAKVPPSFDPESVPGAEPEAWFGEAAGDWMRVKFVLLTVEA